MDCIGSQHSKVPKTEAIGLLESLNNNLDGFFNYSFALQIETFGLLITKPDKNIDYENMTPALKEITSTTFWKNYNTEQNLDTILLLIANNSYVFEDDPSNVKGQNSLLNQFQALINSILDTLLSSNSKQINCRLLLLFGEYRDIMFWNKELDQSETLKKIIRFILEKQIKNEDGEDTSQNLQAIESLSVFFNPKNKDQTKSAQSIQLEQFVLDIMTYIVQIFSVHSDSKLVSIISSILACYPNFIDESNRDLMLSLVDKTVEKIMSPVNNSGQESNQAYNKTYECWNMLFEIVKNKTIMANFGFYIETKLQPIFEILNSSDKLEFDVNIIMIVTDIISMSTSVSDYVMGQFTNHVLNFRLSEEETLIKNLWNFLHNKISSK